MRANTAFVARRNRIVTGGASACQHPCVSRIPPAHRGLAGLPTSQGGDNRSLHPRFESTVRGHRQYVATSSPSQTT